MAIRLLFADLAVVDEVRRGEPVDVVALQAWGPVVAPGPLLVLLRIAARDPIEIAHAIGSAARGEDVEL